MVPGWIKLTVRNFAVLLLVAHAASAQVNFCANDPETVAEHRTSSGVPTKPLPTSVFDDWLENVRQTCTSVDAPADGECLTWEAAGSTFEWQPCGAGGSSAFADLTSGTNTTAAMVVGTGASLTTSGSGTIAATTAGAGDSATAFFSSGTLEVARLPDATTGAKGIVQLAGDLAGTAALPSVVDDSHAHTSTTVSSLDISADTNLAVTAPVVLTDDTLSLNQNAGTDITADLEEETHATEHQNGGADEVSVAGLSGLLADSQTPLSHATSHQNGGTDEISPLQQTIDTCTDGQLLKADIATGKWICGTAGSAAFTTLDTDYGNETITSDFDFGGGTLQVPNSTTLPGTCEVGDSHMDTDADTGQRWFLCESSNTWVLQGGSDSSPYAASYHPDRPPTTCNACEETGSDLTWAWANQGSATITSEMGTLLLDSVDASGGATTHERNARWTSLPTAVDWVVTAKMSMGGALDANTDAGIIILATGTRATPTSMYLLSRGIRSASFDSFQTLCRSVTSYTSATTDIGGPESTQHGLGPWWLQFRFNTTTNTLSCHLSQDGMTWVAMAPGQVLGGDPTDVGIFVDARSVAGTIQARYEYVRVRTDAAGLAGQVGE